MNRYPEPLSLGEEPLSRRGVGWVVEVEGGGGADGGAAGCVQLIIGACDWIWMSWIGRSHRLDR